MLSFSRKSAPPTTPGKALANGGGGSGDAGGGGGGELHIASPSGRASPTGSDGRGSPTSEGRASPGGVASPTSPAGWRPPRPQDPPPLTVEEINAARLELEKLREKQAADKVFQERKRKAEERRKAEEEARARAEAERLKEIERKEREERERQRELQIQLDREGKGKVMELPPPDAPTDPPKWTPLNQETLLVPRGRIDFTVKRVTGVGTVHTGDGSGASTTSAGIFGSMFSGFTTKKSTAGGNGDENDEDDAPKPLRIKDMFVKFELNLGAGNVLAARTPVYRNRVVKDFEMLGADLEFHIAAGIVQPLLNEKLSLPQKLLLPPILFYSVWSRARGGGEVLMAEGQLPAGYFFQPLGAGLMLDVCLPLLAPGAGSRAPNCRHADGTLRAWIACTFRFTPSCAGVLAVSVHEGRGLRQVVLGKMNPMPLLTLGQGGGVAAASRVEVAGALRPVEVIVTGTMCKEGGTDPMFNHEELLVWVDHEHCVAGSICKISLFTENNFGARTEIGHVSVPITQWTSDFLSKEDHLTLRDGAGNPCGALLLTRQFFPAGTLTCRVVAGHQLSAGDFLGGIDAYVKLQLGGRMRSYLTKTRVLPNAGSNPVFDETFIFDVVDHCDMNVSLWDFDTFTEDDLIGEVAVDLGAVYKHGVRDAAVPLKKKNAWGALSDQGLLTLEVDFVGPPDVAYPMLVVDREKFSDELRQNRRARDAAAAAADRKAKLEEARLTEEQKKMAAFAAEALQGRDVKAANDFDDDDIEEAFHLLDFDKNLYISKLELRHALTCLGEEVTDLEIDEMIDMVDVDGDGQVAFYEFYQLCKEALPEVPMWRPLEEKFYRKRDWFAEGGVRNLPSQEAASGGKMLNTIDAKKVVEAEKAAQARFLELKRKREKKEACEAAIGEAGYRLQELQRAFRKFQRHPDYTTGTVTCEALVELLSEGAATAKKLFYAYREEDGRCDFREVMLGLAGFVGCTRPQRINFCFYLYDVDNSGNIDKDELLMILKGSQLASSVNYLRSKAATILETVHVGADGVVDLERFVIAANRFPNVMFPSFEPAPVAGQGRKKVQLMSPEMKQILKDKEETEARVRDKVREREAFGKTKVSALVPVELTGPTPPAGGGGGGAPPSTALVPA